MGFDVQFFLDYNVFSFLKVFDGSLPDDDPENFYMEREWRVLDNSQFAIDQVHRVIIPQTFAQRFRKDVHAYSGQVTLVD